MTVAHMSATKLVRALKDQGLTVVEDGPKIVVTNNNGGLHSFHRSSLEKSGHVYAEIMKDLNALGFQPPDVWEREQRKARREANREEFPFVCEGEAATRFGITCGCGQRFKHANNLGRHLQAVARRAGVVVSDVGETLPKPEPSETTRPATKGEIRRLRTIITHLRRQGEELIAFADEIEPMIQENEDLKRKLRKVEDLFGRVLDEL